MSGNEPGHKDCFPDLAKAIEDAMSLLDITLSDYVELCHSWEKLSAELWKTTDHKEFYLHWQGDHGRANLCANLRNQFMLPWVYDFFMKKNSQKLCDFGCGTASLSFAALLNGRVGHLTCLDVPNYSKEFVDYRIQKYNAGDSAVWDDVLSFDFKKNRETFDVVMCIDVLEHIDNPSDVLRNKIYPLLKRGGQLVLRAPWGRHPEHLKEAIDDFYGKGVGRGFLIEKFKKVRQFEALDVSGVYIKKQ